LQHLFVFKGLGDVVHCAQFHGVNGGTGAHAFRRVAFIKNSSTEIMDPTSSSANNYGEDLGSISVSSLSINWAVDQYVLFTTKHSSNSADDSSYLSGYFIERK
jgi:hypothetical protein